MPKWLYWMGLMPLIIFIGDLVLRNFKQIYKECFEYPFLTGIRWLKQITKP